MKEIQLTQGRVALVDDEDYEKANRIKWYTARRKDLYYAIRSVYFNGKRERQFLHQFIMERKWIDHIDCNGLNCMKINLRYCTVVENSMNRRPNKRSTSIYKGVHWNKEKKKWRCGITYNKIQLQLGSFVSEIEAAKSYDKKAKELFGEFARLNFPE